jgi:hypothetical protein
VRRFKGSLLQNRELILKFQQQYLNLEEKNSKPTSSEARERMRAWLLITVGALVSGCVTNIKPQNDTIRASKVPLGQYEIVLIKPLDAVHGNAESSAAQRIEEVFRKCSENVFRNAKPYTTAAANNGARALIIEPVIVDLKKVNAAQRIFFGALAGSSAGLLRVTYTDAQTKEVVADPTFFARAAAMGGAFSFSATDHGMLTRLPEQACDYSRKNM